MSPGPAAPPNKKIRWGRVLKISTVSVILILIGIDIAGAWLFVGALIHPGCPTPSGLGAGFPSPDEVWLQTERDVQVRAWYYPARNRAAVITLGGLSGSLGSQLPPAGPLLQAGYGVLQIDTRACARPASAVTLGFYEAEEAAAGVDFLLSRAEVDPGRIGIFGFSMGGAGAIRAAARRPQLAAVIAEGGFYNLGQDFVEPGVEKPISGTVFLYTVAGVFWLRTGVNPWIISPVDDIGRISPRPVLLIFGEQESESGRAQIQFEAAGDPKALWTVPGGSHGQNHLAAPEVYTQRVLSFFEQSLLK